MVEGKKTVFIIIYKCCGFEVEKEVYKISSSVATAPVAQGQARATDSTLPLSPEKNLQLFLRH